MSAVNESERLAADEPTIARQLFSGPHAYRNMGIVAVFWIVLLALSAALISLGVIHSFEAMRPALVVSGVEGNPAPVLSTTAALFVPIIVFAACALLVTAFCLSVTVWYALLARFGRANPSP